MTRDRNESPSPSSRRSRRQAIGLAGAAAAAATVAVLGIDRGKNAHAATDDPLIIGQPNAANPGDVTRLDADVDAGAFVVMNENAGPSAGAVAGAALGSGTAVAGHSNLGIGVQGAGPGGQGVGVHGDTFDGIGVRAQCLGAAVPGQPTGPELALDVIGKARFSTAGSGAVPARSPAAAVLNSAVTAVSHITVTFTGDPDKASVAWVQRVAGIGFRVHLSSRPRWEVPFTYLIVEPGV